jgi:hypothetical protein
LPSPWERSFLETTPYPNRVSPFRIYYPVEINTRTTVTVPTGYAASAEMITASPESKELRFTQSSCRVTESEKDLLQIEGRYEARPGLYPPADYLRYQNEMADTIRLLEPKIMLKRHKL